jgi:NitT/TauT family transport system substrate-binding protein
MWLMAGWLPLLALAGCGLAAAPTSPGSAGPAASSAAVSASPAPSSGVPEHMTLIQSTQSSEDIPIWVAEDGGIFARNGLNVDAQVILGASAAMSTIVAQKAEIGFFSGSAVLSAAAGGANVKVIGSGSPVIPFQLFVPADIKTAADLKGKKVDLGTIGSAIDVDTKIALQRLGLKPEDVTFVTTGSPQTAVAALEAGSIQARLVNPPDSVQLQAKGFHSLLDLAALKLPAATTVFVVRGDYLDQHRPALQRFIDSMVEASAKARADRAFTTGVMKKYLKLDDDKAIGAAYDYFVGEVIPALPAASPDQFISSRDALASTAPAVSNVDLDSLIDPSFVQSAASRGLDSTPPR